MFGSQEFLKLVRQNFLLRGSLFLFFGTTLANFLSYLFQLLMGRFLGKDEYGTLITLIALLALLTIPTSTFQTTIVKFVSEWKGKRQQVLVLKLFGQLFRLFCLFGTLVILVFLPSRIWLSDFLRIKEQTLLFGLVVLVVLTPPMLLPVAFLQGLLRFESLAAVNLIFPMLKIVLGTIFVLLGFKALGAIFAMIVGILITGVAAFVLLRKDLVDGDGERLEWGGLFKFFAATFLTTLALTSLINSDLILVKHFFQESLAGIYSAASVLGRIIFFGLGSIGGVIFPYVSLKNAAGEDFKNAFIWAFGIEIFLILAAIFVYTFLPDLLLKVLFFGSEKFKEASPLLPFFAIFISLYSLLSLLTGLFLALKKTWVALILFGGAMLQILGIWSWHGSLTQVLLVSVFVNFSLVCLLGVFALRFLALSNE